MFCGECGCVFVSGRQVLEFLWWRELCCRRVAFLTFFWIGVLGWCGCTEVLESCVFAKCC